MYVCVCIKVNGWAPPIYINIYWHTLLLFSNEFLFLPSKKTNMNSWITNSFYNNYDSRHYFNFIYLFTVFFVKKMFFFKNFFNELFRAFFSFLVYHYEIFCSNFSFLFFRKKYIWGRIIYWYYYHLSLSLLACVCVCVTEFFFNVEFIYLF